MGVFYLQLQTLVSDEVCMKFTDLFLQAVKKGGAGGSCDTCDQRAGAEITYQKQAEKIDPEENCYKVIFVSHLRKFISLLIPYSILW